MVCRQVSTSFLKNTTISMFLVNVSDMIFNDVRKSSKKNIIKYKC